jgi:hypothetical protein
LPGTVALLRSISFLTIFLKAKMRLTYCRASRKRASGM